MTNEEVMVELKSTLRYIANSRRATNAQVRAALLLAITEGADRITIRDMAMAVGLYEVHAG